MKARWDSPDLDSRPFPSCVFPACVRSDPRFLLAGMWLADKACFYSESPTKAAILSPLWFDQQKLY